MAIGWNYHSALQSLDPWPRGERAESLKDGLSEQDGSSPGYPE